MQRFLERNTRKSKKDGAVLRSQSYLTYLFYLIGVFVFLGAILLLWNHTLRRKVTKKTVQLQEAFKDLEKSEELFRSYLEYAPDGVYMSDVKGNLIYGNRKVEEIIGYRREDLIGKNFLELNLLTEKGLNKAVQWLQENVKGNPTGPDEIELINKEGRLIPVEISTSMFNAWGRESSLVLFVTSLTASGRKTHCFKVRENTGPFLKISRKVILKLILPVTLPFSTIHYADSLAIPRKN